MSYQNNIDTQNYQSEPFYLQQLQTRNGDPFMDTTKLSGIAYFIMIFESVFENDTNKLQLGETTLTEAMQKLTAAINKAKDEKLHKDLYGTGPDDKNCLNYWVTHSDDDKNGSNALKWQSIYKNDDTQGQSMLQAMNPITTTDSDLTTSISQNNNTINQMATSILNILKMLAEQLIRLS